MNSEVYGLKRNMCRMTQTVDMKLETVNPCRKEESVEGGRKVDVELRTDALQKALDCRITLTG